MPHKVDLAGDGHASLLAVTVRDTNDYVTDGNDVTDRISKVPADHHIALPDVTDSSLSPPQSTSSDILRNHTSTDYDASESLSFMTTLHYDGDVMSRCLQDNGHLTSFAQEVTIDVTPSLVDMRSTVPPLTCTLTVKARSDLGLEFSLRPGKDCYEQSIVTISDTEKSDTWYPSCHAHPPHFTTNRNVVELVVKIRDNVNEAPFTIQAAAIAFRLQVVHTSPMEG